MDTRTDRKRPPAGSFRSHGHDNGFSSGKSRGVKVGRRGSRADPRVERTRYIYIPVPRLPKKHELPAESTASRALDRVYLPVLTWPA